MGNSKDPFPTHPTLPLDSIVYSISCNSPGSPSSPQSCSSPASPASPGSQSSTSKKKRIRPYDTVKRRASYIRCKERKKDQEEIELLQQQQQLELLQQQELQAQVELLVQQRLVGVAALSLSN